MNRVRPPLRGVRSIHAFVCLWAVNNLFDATATFCVTIFAIIIEPANFQMYDKTAPCFTMYIFTNPLCL